VRSSVFTLCSSALGAGCLSLPYAVRVAGLGFGLVAMAAASGLTALSGSVLVRYTSLVRAGASASLSEPSRVPSWAMLLEAKLGACGGILMEVILLLLGGGVILLYYSFVGDFLGSLRDAVQVPEASAPRWALILGSLAVTVPLSLPGEIGALQGSSVLILAILVAMALVASVALAVCNGPGAAGEPVAWGPASPGGVLQAFCSFIFTQMFHLNVFTVYEGLRAPHAWSPRSLEPRAVADTKRMQNIVVFAVAVCSLLNLWIALSGYLLWRGDTLQDFVLNYTDDKGSQGCPAWLPVSVRASQALLTLGTLCSIPINVVPTRLCLAGLGARLLGRGGSAARAAELPCQSLPGRCLLTAGLCGLLAALAATTHAVATIIGFLGGTLSTVLMFVLPAMLYWGSSLDEGRPLVRAATLAAFLFGAAVGFSNVVVLVASLPSS